MILADKIIDRDSPHFVEQPTREALRFLGLENTPYYANWFPEDSEEAEAQAASEAEAGSPEELAEADAAASEAPVDGPGEAAPDPGQEGKR